MLFISARFPFIAKHRFIKIVVFSLVLIGFLHSERSQDSIQNDIENIQNSGKRRSRSASDAPNCSHRRSDFFKVPVARIWRFRGAPRSTFSIVFEGVVVIRKVAAMDVELITYEL